MATSKALAKRTAGTDLTVQEIVGRRQRVNEIFKKLMKNGVHYGTIPGTPKPSLWKPGAEMLCVAFRIAPAFAIENLSDDDHYEFIVTCTGTHQPTGLVLGQGMGSGSTNEGKYKWRKAVCEDEFKETDDDRKRQKWEKNRNDGGAFQVDQIRTEPDDQVNTVLKMANKRAHVAMTINVLAVSDMFTQDLEDQGGADDSGGGSRQHSRPPQSSGGGGSAISQAQKGLLVRKLGDAGIDGKLLCEHFKVAELDALPKSQMDAALQWIQGPKGGNGPT